MIAVAALGFSTGYALSAAEPKSQDAPKPATPADGIYNQAQAQRGQTTYTQACSACHPADSSGSDQAPSLAGGDFLDRGTVKALATSSIAFARRCRRTTSAASTHKARPTSSLTSCRRTSFRRDRTS